MTPERIKELREWLGREAAHSESEECDVCPFYRDLLAVLDDYENVRGRIEAMEPAANSLANEVERLRGELSAAKSIKILTLNELAEMARRAEKAEAELVALKQGKS